MNRRGKIRISGEEVVTLGAFNNFALIKNHLVFLIFLEYIRQKKSRFLSWIYFSASATNIQFFIMMYQ